MLEQARIFGLISVLAISLTACSGNSDSATTVSPDESSTAAAPSSPTASKPNETATTVSNTEIKTGQIKFKGPGTTSYGVFDAVNDSIALSHKVSKAKPIKLSGWAILANKSKVADNVIITSSDNKKVLAIGTVNTARPDVANQLKNSAYKTSGWSATINTSALPTGKTVLQAWALDSATNEAIQLGRSHELNVTE